MTQPAQPPGTAIITKTEPTAADQARPSRIATHGPAALTPPGERR